MYSIAPSSQAFSRNKLAGFTLIEMMTVIAVLAVLMALAAPSFTPLMERWRVRQASELFQSTIYFARSEALKGGGNVVISSLPAGACNGAGWDCGWQVCVDADADQACGNGETILQRYDTPNGVTVALTGAGAGNIVVDSRGFFNSASNFNVIPSGKTASDPSAKGVCIDASGIVRIVPSHGGGINC